MAEISLENLSKTYPDGTRAVIDLSMEVADGELVVFVGPSGCGKTSALRMVAGLEEITGGTVRIDGDVVNGWPPKDRDIAMIFQNYALYPHMSAYDNMAFALKMKRVDKEEIDRRVREAARVLGLSDVLKKKPRTLSGGQRQRVAMGRAIVREPRAFLMDEPLSNLDAKLRVQMRAEIARLQRDLGVTTVYVTHDQSEAMTLGDRVVVMRKGELQQLAAPQVLYNDPDNLFVAEFIGSPAMNLALAGVVRENGGFVVTFGSHRLPLPPEVLAARPSLEGYAGREVALGIRPEDLEDAALAPDAPADQRLAVVVDIRENMGSEVFLHFGIDAPPVATADVREAVEAEGVAALKEQAKRHGDPFVARVGRECRAREGDSIELVVTTRLLHFFDVDTGRAIRG